MIRITDIHYVAEEGKCFSRVADNMIFGSELHLGLLFRDLSGNILDVPVQDLITNYVEVEAPVGSNYPAPVIEPEPEPEPEMEPEIMTLAEAKIKRINELMVYDSSPSVNQFYLNGTPEWFPLERRLGLMASLEIAIKNEVESIPFVVGGSSVEIPPTVALPMIQKLHLQYADVCFIITQTHKANIEALATAKEVLEYDFTIGYPEKLNFEL